MGLPVCPLAPGSFVPVWLASTRSQDSPDETSLEKSCFSTLLPQPSQHTHTHTHTHTSTAHRYPLPWKLTGRREKRICFENYHFRSFSFFSLLFFHPSLVFTFFLCYTSLSQCSLWSSGDCASGLCSPMMNDLPKNTVCMQASSIQVEELTSSVRNHTTFRPLFHPSIRRLATELNICVYLLMCVCVCVCDNLQPFWNE